MRHGCKVLFHIMGLNKPFKTHWQISYTCITVDDITYCMFYPKLGRGDPFLTQQSACWTLNLLSVKEKDLSRRLQLSWAVPDRKLFTFRKKRCLWYWKTKKQKHVSSDITKHISFCVQEINLSLFLCVFAVLMAHVSWNNFLFLFFFLMFNSFSLHSSVLKFALPISPLMMVTVIRVLGLVFQY